MTFDVGTVSFRALLNQSPILACNRFGLEGGFFYSRCWELFFRGKSSLNRINLQSSKFRATEPEAALLNCVRAPCRISGSRRDCLIRHRDTLGKNIWRQRVA